MKSLKKLLSLALSAVMLFGLMPVCTFAAGEAAVAYSTILPEYMLLNAVTGNDADVFDNLVKGNHKAQYYNTIRKFVSEGKYLEYSKAYTAQTAVWSNFTSTNLYKLAFNSNSDLKLGNSATFINNNHTHSWGSIFSKKSQSMTSYASMMVTLGSSRTGTPLYGSSRISSPQPRLGDMSYSALPSGITAQRSLNLTTALSSLTYDNGICSGCGAGIQNQVICFYDGNAPEVLSVELQDGTAGNNFKPGDTVEVTVLFDEVMRFADNSANHGGAYVELMLEGETAGSKKNPKAYLTGLQTVTIGGSTLSEASFVYTIPATETGTKTISAVNLATLKKETDLVQVDKTEVLDFAAQKVITNSGSVLETISLKKSGEGYTTATSPFVDAAGNSLCAGDFGQYPVRAYIDGEAPTVAEITMNASVNNSDVKTQLYQSAADSLEDNSDIYLGQGDTASFTVAFSELLSFSGGSGVSGAKITTNLKDSSGNFVTAAYLGSGSKYLGPNFGKGVSGGYVTYVAFQPIRMTAGMSCADADGVIRVTKVEFPGTAVQDASGNIYSAVSSLEPNLTLSRFKLDITEPELSGADAPFKRSISDQFAGFSYQVDIADTGLASGVEGLKGEFSLSDENGASFRYEWAAAAAAGKEDGELTWAEGVSGVSYEYLQHTGGKTYFYVRFLRTEQYNLQTLRLTVSASDYAGNRSEKKDFVLAYVVDNVAPTVAEQGAVRTYAAGTGTMTVSFAVNDANGFGENSAEYIWTASDGAPQSGAAWETASLLNTGATEQTYTAAFTVEDGEQKSQRLWIRASDAFGNSTEAIPLGTYTYDLTKAIYAVNSSNEVTSHPGVALAALGGDDAVLALFRSTDMEIGEEKVWFAYYTESTGELLNTGGDIRAVTISEHDGTYTLNDVEETYSVQLSSWKTALKKSYYGAIEVTIFAGKKYTPELGGGYSGSFNGNSLAAISEIGGNYSAETRIVRTGGSGTGSKTPAEVVDAAMTITENDGSTRYLNTDQDYLGSDGYKELEAGNTMRSDLNGLTLHLSLSDLVIEDWGVEALDFSTGLDGHSKTRLEVVHYGTKNSVNVAAVDLAALTEQDLRIPADIVAAFGSGIYVFRLKVVLKSGLEDTNYFYRKGDGTLGIAPLSSQTPLSIQVERAETASDFRFSYYSVWYGGDAAGNSYSGYIDTAALTESSINIDPSAHVTGDSAQSGVAFVTVPVSQGKNLSNPTAENSGAAGFLTTLRLVDFSANKASFSVDADTTFCSGVRWAKITNTADGETITKWLCFDTDTGLGTEGISLNLYPVDSGAEMKALEAQYIDDAQEGMLITQGNKLLFVSGKTNILTVEFYQLNGEKSETRVLYVNAASDVVTGSIRNVPADESEKNADIYSTTNGVQDAARYTDKVKTIFTPAEGTDTDGLRVFISIIGKQYDYTHTGGVWQVGSRKSGVADDEMTLNPDGSYSYVWDDYYTPLFAVSCYNEKTRLFSMQMVNNGSVSCLLSDKLRSDDGAPTVYGTAGAGTILTERALEEPALKDNGDGTWSMTFTVKDSVIEECGEMTLTMMPTAEYAALLGVNPGESFRFTFAKHLGSDGNTTGFAGDAMDADGRYTAWSQRDASSIWMLTDDASPLGIYTAGAQYISVYSTGKSEDDDDIAIVTVTGAVPETETGSAEIAFCAEVADRFGNTAEFSVSGAADYQAPEMYEKADTSDVYGFPNYAAVSGYDRELTAVFTQPVRVKKSWKCSEPSGYEVSRKLGELPVTEDGEAVLEVYDVFGRLRQVNYTFKEEFTPNYTTEDQHLSHYAYGVTVSVSETELTTEPVTITVTAPELAAVAKGYPKVGLGASEGKSQTLTVTENGVYTFKIFPSKLAHDSNETDYLTFYIDNICTEELTAEPFFYFCDTGNGYLASELPNRNGDHYDPLTVSGNVMVSYSANRYVYPTEGTEKSVTLKPDGAQTYCFAYADQLGNSGTLSVDLADYGIRMTSSKATHYDENAPAVTVSVLEKIADGFRMVSSFVSTYTETEIAGAMDALEYFQSIRLSLSISDESSCKTVVTLAKPENLTYDTAGSDSILGLSLSGTSITVTDACQTDTFYLSVVDHASAETDSEADNVTTMKITLPLERFDTAAPQVSVTYENGLYLVDAVFSVTDTINSGTDAADIMLGDGSSLLGKIAGSDSGLLRDADISGLFRYTLTENGKKFFDFVDYAGNHTPVEVETDHVDESVPELSVKWSPCAGGTDPDTGKRVLYPEQAATGPVNTDITAVITSTRGIASYKIETICGSDNEPVNTMPASDDAEWSDYYSPYCAVSAGIDTLTLCLKAASGAYGIWIKVTVTAPNGKTAVKILGVPAGVMDASAPIVKVTAEPLYRNEDCTEPYAYRLKLFPDASGAGYSGSGDSVIYLSNDPGTADASGKVVRTAYTAANPYSVTVRADKAYVYHFVDAAGNQTTVGVDLPSDTTQEFIRQIRVSSPPDGEYTGYWMRRKSADSTRTTYQLLTDPEGDPIVLHSIDTAAPELRFDPTLQEMERSSRVAVQNVTVTANEPCTIEYSYTCTENGKTVAKSLKKAITDPGKDALSLSFTEDTVLLLTATDGSGNTVQTSLPIENLDNTAPTLTVDISTLSVRQGTTPAELTDLLAAGVQATDTWKGTVSTLTPAFDLSRVRLDTVGIYTVTITAADAAGNKTTATRTVRVTDKNAPVIRIDGLDTDPDSITVLKAGKHSISISNLPEIAKGEQEPCKLYLREGMRTIGQMKDTSQSRQILGGTVSLEPGYYTLYVVTQSRRAYRLILYVEK